ncbi:TetR/AcrR family transcriptional regulator [Pseudarthrobacter sp. L19]|uniref:TetR/AcrR family transcriptional regulator n=1 Tax=Pseudarthrobacter sp. L19 TaxID=3423951 RepID=UPI003D7923D9
MPTAAPRPGRRERNKQDKLDRITAAARELFTEFGVDDVTTQQIADKADIGTGTLFLYARTKAELLLLVQNSAYADALVRGTAAAERAAGTLDAVMAILRPVVECNRVQVDNGRTYLREVVFGDPGNPTTAMPWATRSRPRRPWPGSCSGARGSARTRRPPWPTSSPRSSSSPWP